jgi:hypothetical protein
MQKAKKKRRERDQRAKENANLVYLVTWCLSLKDTKKKLRPSGFLCSFFLFWGQKRR